MRHIIGTSIIFLILVGEDFFMGMFGGYTATGGDFFSYLSSLTLEHVAVILVASIIIYLVLRRVFKI